jgi:hypothetical protein
VSSFHKTSVSRTLPPVLRFNRPDIEPISKQLTIVIGLTVVGFMAFGLALSFYRNILFEKTLADLEAQNKKITDAIAQGDRTLEYYNSEQFKDKYAKENLGRLNPGEKALLIAQVPKTSPFSLEDDAEEQERKEAAYFELLRQMPVLEHWKMYFFHRDRVEEFKGAL